MNPVVEVLLRVLPSRQRTIASGLIQIDCPACGDKRRRGGIFFTPSGGFWYKCKNGGCEYQDTTGWEPERGLFGRPRRLFELLGGSLSDIPIEMWMWRPTSPTETIRKYDAALERYSEYLSADDTAIRLRPHFEVATNFPELSLPTGSVPLFDHSRPATNKLHRACQSYILNRGTFFVDHSLVWSPSHPAHVICPLKNRGKVVGWIGRCVEKGRPPHLKCQRFPTDYMLNQDQTYNRDIILVQEGTFDALALGSLCTFGNKLSRKQINLLNQFKAKGHRIVLLPDFQGDEWQLYWRAAAENNWYLSVPAYPYSGKGAEHIKDAGDSIRRNGLLLTAEAIVDGITDNYIEARTNLIIRSQG